MSSDPACTIFEPAAEPTLHFIGVSTAQSSIMRVFPRWADFLGLEDAAIDGMDFVPNDRPEHYREAVRFIRDDPLSRGALVTTHKLDLFAAARDLFDEIDPLADAMAETSCLAKRDGKLCCSAKDPITAGLAIDGFLPEGHFAESGSDLFVMGAGGSAIAITWHLMQTARRADRPARIIVCDPVADRLHHLSDFHGRGPADIPVDCRQIRTASDNDRILDELAPGSLIVNATGLGKDRPGSPLSDSARFPESSIVFELNYRGDLVFLEQARHQAAARGLAVHDGWTYFIHGWTRVIAEVFDIDIPVAGTVFDEISRIAAEATGRPA
ncbi:MAG: hypothetical protein R3C97_12405 [Geminicoccaceae bacterium]